MVWIHSPRVPLISTLSPDLTRPTSCGLAVVPGPRHRIPGSKDDLFPGLARCKVDRHNGAMHGTY